MHRGRIPGNIWSVGDEMSYIPSKFVKIVIKLPAELMRIRCNPAFVVPGRHRNSPRVLILHELWRHPLRTLLVGINARWVSVNLLAVRPARPPIQPPIGLFDNRWHRCLLVENRKFFYSHRPKNGHNGNRAYVLAILASCLPDLWRDLPSLAGGLTDSWSRPSHKSLQAYKTLYIHVYAI